MYSRWDDVHAEGRRVFRVLLLLLLRWGLWLLGHVLVRQRGRVAPGLLIVHHQRRVVKVAEKQDEILRSAHTSTLSVQLILIAKRRGDSRAGVFAIDELLQIPEVDGVVVDPVKVVPS